MKAVLIKTEVNYILENEEGVIIASTSCNKEGLKLSLDNCKNIELGYNLEDLAYEWVFDSNGHKWSNNDDSSGDNYGSFKAGFEKAIEILGDKKYDISAIYAAIDFGKMQEENRHFGLKTENINYFIDFINQKKWNVDVEVDDVFNENNETYIEETGAKGNYNTHTKKLRLDSDGCLILKKTCRVD